MKEPYEPREQRESFDIMNRMVSVLLGLILHKEGEESLRTLRNCLKEEGDVRVTMKLLQEVPDVHYEVDEYVDVVRMWHSD